MLPWKSFKVFLGYFWGLRGVDVELAGVDDSNAVEPSLGIVVKGHGRNGSAIMFR
jgi:hypothetical protein